MNRQTILASVHRQLRESLAETGEVRPLVEIVARVASEIRSEDETPQGDTLAAVVPIEKVASFVDGHLEPSDASLICDAVMVDNSVLAELVAAVRATQTPVEQMSPLSPSLAARLNAMQSEHLSRPAASPSGAEQDASVVPAIRVHDAIDPAGESESSRPRIRLHVAVSLLAVAATIVIAIIVLGRSGNQEPDDSMIVESSEVTASPPSQPDEFPTFAPDAEEKRVKPQNVIAESEPTLPPADPGPSIPAPELERIDEPARPSERAMVKDYTSVDENVPVSPEPNRLDVANPIRMSAAVPKLADFKWTEISGLMTQRNEPTTDPSSQQRSITWKNVQEGSIAGGSSDTQSQIAIRTLPFSRASGEFATGGKIVVAEDTGLLIDRSVEDVSAQFNLLHGSIAMMNIGEGTLVNLRLGQQQAVTLRWKSKASAVLHRDATGLQVQVDGGSIEVNDELVDDKAVRVAADDAVEKIRAPKRLPRWVSRPDDSTVAEKMILAQIADSRDVTSALAERVNALSASNRLNRDETLALAKLASWHAAMSGANLYRLANSRVAATRVAGLQRLAQMPETDPRYQRTWIAIERAVNNPQRFRQMRLWFQMVRNGRRPNAVQTESLLAGLSSRDFAGRVISDFILRQYVRNPPPFDPTWTGQTLQRAVNVYRDRAGMPVDRSRPNAAASSIR